MFGSCVAFGSLFYVPARFLNFTLALSGDKSFISLRLVSSVAVVATVTVVNELIQPSSV